MQSICFLTSGFKPKYAPTGTHFGLNANFKRYDQSH